MTLPRDWATRVEPLPGQFFCTRHEQPSTTPSGRVLLSENFVRGVRKPMATVVRSAVEGIPVGATVLLSPGVSRRMVFGEREDQITYYVGIGRGSVQYIWPPEIEAPEVTSAGSQQGRWAPPEDLTYDESRADEGLPLQPSAGRD